MWEALLKHWQDKPLHQSIRDLLSQTLLQMAVAIELVVDPY